MRFGFAGGVGSAGRSSVRPNKRMSQWLKDMLRENEPDPANRDPRRGLSNENEMLRVLYRNEQRRLAGWAAFAHQTKEDASGFWWVRELDVTHIATYLLNEEGVYHQRLADNLNMLTVANALTLTVTATLASGAGFFDPNTKNDSDDRTWRAVQYLMIIATVIEALGMSITSYLYSAMCYGVAFDIDAWVLMCNSCGMLYFVGKLAGPIVFVLLFNPVIAMLQLQLVPELDAHIMFGIAGVTLTLALTAIFIMTNYVQFSGLAKSYSHNIVHTALKDCYIAPASPGGAWKLKASWRKRIREVYGDGLELWATERRAQQGMSKAEAAEQLKLLLEELPSASEPTAAVSKTRALNNDTEVTRIIYRNEQRRVMAWLHHAHRGKSEREAHWWSGDVHALHMPTFLLSDEGVYSARISDNIVMLNVTSALMLTIAAALAAGGGIGVDESRASENTEWRASQYLLCICTFITTAGALCSAMLYGAVCYGCACDVDTYVMVCYGLNKLYLFIKLAGPLAPVLFAPAMGLVQIEMIPTTDAHVCLGLVCGYVVLALFLNYRMAGYTRQSSLRDATSFGMVKTLMEKCYSPPLAPHGQWRLKAEWRQRLHAMYGQHFEQVIVDMLTGKGVSHNEAVEQVEQLYEPLPAETGTDNDGSNATDQTIGFGDL